MLDIKSEVYTHWICEALFQNYQIDQYIKSYSERTKKYWLWNRLFVEFTRICLCFTDYISDLLGLQSILTKMLLPVHCEIYLAQAPKSLGICRHHHWIPVFPSISCVTLLSPNRRNPIIFIKLIPQTKQTPIVMSSSKPLKMPLSCGGML